MCMEHLPERGFLVLADITGFTAFVTGTELEHGPPIIAELLEVVIRHLVPPLEVQELEGDAVFAFGPDRTIVPAATLLGPVGDAFAAFRARRRDLAADETCSCKVCRSVSKLDLKIVAHHGTFLRQMVGGRRQLAGTDVILVHRLLKNRLVRTTGYLLLTEAALGHMHIAPTSVGLIPQTERYDHLGEVRCFVAEPGFTATCSDALHEGGRLQPPGQQQNDEDQDKQPKTAGGVVAPPAAVWPQRQSTDQQQDEDHQENRVGAHTVLRRLEPAGVRPPRWRSRQESRSSAFHSGFST
jgi:hypothetical protein